MHISAPPPSLADMRPSYPVDGLKNPDAQSKFSSVSPKDQVTLSPAARELRQEDQEKAEQSSSARYATSVVDLSTEEFLDLRLARNSEMVSGVELTQVANVGDEMKMDARIVLDSAYIYAVSRTQSNKADALNDGGSGESINILLEKAHTDPSLAFVNEARQAHKRNTDYDTIRMMSREPVSAQPNDTDLVPIDQLGESLEVRFQEQNANRPNLPDANVAVALKKYAEVAQSIEY